MVNICVRCVEGISLDGGASIAPVTKMVAADDIKDSESLERWREEWPKSQRMDEEAARKVAVSIARRAAMQCAYFRSLGKLTRVKSLASGN